MNRREFLSFAGLSAMAAVVGPATQVFASQERETAPDGKRWAMVIDLKKCLRDEGCDKCRQVCHQKHNVPDFGADNRKDEIKWIWKEPYERAFPNQAHRYAQTSLRKRELPVLCNHCDKPPCVRVCPTKATFRRDNDGIVMMDQHRCIGCRFCVAACPYGSRSFNWKDPRGKDENGKRWIEKPNLEYPTRTKGVVEKCTFCAKRIGMQVARGETPMPYCVEKCQGGAMAFGDMNDETSTVRRLLESRHAIRRLPGLGTNPQIFYLV